MRLSPRIWLFGLAFGLILAGIAVKLFDTWGTFGHTIGPWAIGLLVLLVVLCITFLGLSLFGQKTRQNNP